MEKEQVNHPAHYQGKIECIDAMVDFFGEEEAQIFCKINAFKYQWREGEKEGNPLEQDKKKARWYHRTFVTLGKKIFERTYGEKSTTDVEELAQKNEEYFKRIIKEYKETGKCTSREK